MKEISVFWFRRDLRLRDNAGLYHALKNGVAVLPVFIFDTDILDKLSDKKDRRVNFIFWALAQLQKELEELGSSLLVSIGKPIDIYKKILSDYKVHAVYTNHDYEPYAIARDRQIHELLQQHNIPFKTFKDQVVFEYKEVVKDDGLPYTVFTPYSRKWKSQLNDFYTKPYPVEKYLYNFIQTNPFPKIEIEDIGFSLCEMGFNLPVLDQNIISQYEYTRDFPAVPGTSRISIHLRFGTISIRHLVTMANQLSESWLNELIWRDFYMCILYHFPQVEDHAFKKPYDQIKWRNNEHEFDVWCNGQTGYPIVDAGMRELNSTGFMHNRVRMIVASFLTKHLLIDWRWGAAYFAEKLLDFDLAANNGGWQWAASSGCDAVPYFRIFNPYEQTKKFDPELRYIRKWVPEFEDFSYPRPMVEHKFARERALKVYKESLQNMKD